MTLDNSDILVEDVKLQKNGVITKKDAEIIKKEVAACISDSDTDF